MPANGYNTGRDISLDIVDPTQGPLSFDITTSWNAEPQYTELESIDINGNVLFADLPKGHNGKFTLDRGSAEVDAYFAANEATYFGGKVVSYVQITETITNPDGSVSVFRYTQVAMRLTNAGKWAGESKVEMEIACRASRRLQIS